MNFFTLQEFRLLRGDEDILGEGSGRKKMELEELLNVGMVSAKKDSKMRRKGE